MNRRLALLLLAAVAAGCAQRDLVVLLPDRDGRVGTLVAQKSGEEVVLDEPYAALRASQAGRASKTLSSPEEVQTEFGDALAAQPPRPVSFLLYFVTGTDELTQESRVRADEVIQEIAKRPAPEVTVIGHTDRVGPMSDNDRLALQRAKRVRTDLIGLGIPPEQIDVAGRGEREPLVSTDDEVPEPRNRRVEINVR